MAEQFFTDLVADRPMAEVMLDLILEQSCAIGRALAEVGDLVDIAMAETTWGCSSAR